MKTKYIVAVGIVGVIVLAAVALRPPRAPQTPSPAPSATRVASPSPVPTGPIKDFTVEGSNFKFTPDKITVNQGDSVRITFKNVMGMHDFRISEYQIATDIIKGGAQQVVEFTADKLGSFEFYCSVGNHRQMGMVGKLTVE